MLKIRLFLLAIGLSIPLLSHCMQNLDGMNKKEIKQLLLEHEDVLVNKHIMEYSNKKTTGICLLVISVITAFFARDKKKKNRNVYDDSEGFSIRFLTASGLAFVIGILLLITADNAFKKSKEAYLNPLADNIELIKR